MVVYKFSKIELALLHFLIFNFCAYIGFKPAGSPCLDHDVPTLTLKLKKPKTDKKVQWSTETVDNEHMNKKKSKCCCVYEKPRQFGESSSSDSDDECEHCKGHVEKKRKKRELKHAEATSSTSEAVPETVITVTEPSDPAKPQEPQKEEE